jgi:hypothetical protein
MVKRENDERLVKTLQTFSGEAKRAMHPAVRDDFADILAVRDEAWQAEVDALAIDKAAPCPIKKWAKRRYHALVYLLREAADGNWLTTTDEVVAYATANDPDLNAEKMFAKVESLREQLQELYATFPVDDFGVAIDALNEVTKAHMEVARNQKLGVPEPAKKAPVQRRQPAPAKTAPTVVAESTNEDVSGVAEGASDILDDVLSDYGTTTLAAAA